MKQVETYEKCKRWLCLVFIKGLHVSIVSKQEHRSKFTSTKQAQVKGDPNEMLKREGKKDIQHPKLCDLIVDFQCLKGTHKKDGDYIQEHDRIRGMASN